MGNSNLKIKGCVLGHVRTARERRRDTRIIVRLKIQEQMWGGGMEEGYKTNLLFIPSL